MNNDVKGRSLELFFIDGRPDGMLTAEVFNWTGHVLGILPALRVDSFLKNTRPAAPNDARLVPLPEITVFELHARKHGIRAVARLENGEFVVEQGSLARKKWESSSHSYRDLQAELVRTGVLQEDGEHRVFKDNYAFKSPSAAAAVVLGRSARGPFDWKVQGQKQTYGEWEAERLARDRTEGSI